MSLFIEFQSFLTILLTAINKSVLINNTYFAIKINIINYFLNNRIKLKWNI